MEKKRRRINDRSEGSNAGDEGWSKDGRSIGKRIEDSKKVIRRKDRGLYEREIKDWKEKGWRIGRKRDGSLEERDMEDWKEWEHKKG